MNQESIEEDTLSISQAVRILVERGSVGVDSESCLIRIDTNAAVLRAGLPAGPTVLVFTRKDLAESHARRAKLPALDPATFGTQDEFLKFLRWLKDVGMATHLLFDPGDKPAPSDKLESIE